MFFQLKIHLRFLDIYTDDIQKLLDRVLLLLPEDRAGTQMSRSRQILMDRIENVTKIVKMALSAFQAPSSPSIF